MSDTLWMLCAPCPLCDVRSRIEVPTEGLARYNAGATVQESFPALLVAEREMIISGTCPACWDSMFSDEEDE